MTNEFKTIPSILYIGPIGRNWIHECIPNHVQLSFLELTNIFHHLLSLRSLYFFCLNFFRDFTYVIRHPRSLARFSILDAYKRDLVLSCSDNWPWLQEYAARRDIPVILVQNATRKCTERTKRFSSILPTYCAWGDLEHQIFHSCAISVTNFHPVGSIKLGIALEHFQKLSSKESHDIVFISQFRPTKGFLDSSADPDSIDSLISEYQSTSFQLLRDFAERNNRRITVISKTRGPKDYPLEINYFRELAKGIDFDYVEGDKDQKDFSTYFSCFSSRLIVSLNSSLGFELLAIGKKVLFCGSGIENFADQFDVGPYFDSLPLEVKLETATFENFNQKLQTLEGFSDIHFKELVAEQTKLIVNFSPDDLTHHKVRRIILDSLKSSAAIAASANLK